MALAAPCLEAGGGHRDFSGLSRADRVTCHLAAMMRGGGVSDVGRWGVEASAADPGAPGAQIAPVHRWPVARHHRLLQKVLLGSTGLARSCPTNSRHAPPRVFDKSVCRSEEIFEAGHEANCKRAFVQGGDAEPQPRSRQMDPARWWIGTVGSRNNTARSRLNTVSSGRRQKLVTAGTSQHQKHCRTTQHRRVGRDRRGWQQTVHEITVKSIDPGRRLEAALPGA